jgi:hypothetical protein
LARTLIIGDVHGCSVELRRLLDLLGPTADDTVVFVGDLIARGPDSAGVLSLFGELGARSVLGNHEARLLEAHRARMTGTKGPLLGSRHVAVLRELSDEHWALLETLPLYLDLPDHGARVLHAGVLPGVAFEKQDAWTLTHIRSVGADGTPSDVLGAASWAERYLGEPHIVFGHDSRRKLQLHAHATGLDTGCVYGGSLTALVLAENASIPFPKERRDILVSVRARAAYYSPNPAGG